MEKATRQQTRTHNLHLVLKTIFERESISRAEIARMTALTRTTVSAIVGDLIDAGLVQEIGAGPSLGGKSPILLSVVPDARFMIGVDLTDDHFVGAMVNLRGEIRHRITQPIDDLQGEQALQALYQLLDSLLESPGGPLVGIGVAAPGLVNADQGTVMHSVNLGWEEVPLAHLLQERYQLPVMIFNDSQTAAMGEYTFGDGHPSESSLIVVHIGRGIGAGILINGQLFCGDGGGAGEIGHIQIIRDGGKRCRCGNLGCLETVGSTQAVLEQIRLRLRNGEHSEHLVKTDRITFESVASAFKEGDPLVCDIFSDLGTYLGQALANLVGTLNIHRIILSGEIVRLGPSFLEQIRKTLDHTTLPGLARATHLEFGRLGEDAVILGASAMVLTRYPLLFHAHRLTDKT